MSTVSAEKQTQSFADFLNQNYDEIKAKCLAEGILFEDPEFEACDESMYFSQKPIRPFEWKRPTEICENPQFIDQHGAGRFDVQQGMLGDCWLLAATASLTINKTLFARVVPTDQNFTDDYCGLFRFRFWHQGDWVEVLVDDRLPTHNNKLVFMHSAENKEFWSALIEKAYAKLHGSYESLKGGDAIEGMEDFTGGVSEMFDLKKAPDNLFTIMMNASDRGSLMGCSINAGDTHISSGWNGLVAGQAYSITAVKQMDINSPPISMVRVRNPWGNAREWAGPWSDMSNEWQQVPETERQSIGLTFDDDGEFWMSFEDWVKEFHKLEICNLDPDSLNEIQSDDKQWAVTKHSGQWTPRVNAGGCRNFIDTFWTNPQYKVTLVDSDDDKDDLCSLLVAVLQKDRRKQRKYGLGNLNIGYSIYKIQDGMSSDSPLDKEFFMYNKSTARSPNFINMREICGRHKLHPGTYVIIPSTFKPHQKGEYLVRIFSEKANQTGEMDEQTGMIDDQESEPTEEERRQEAALTKMFPRVAGEDKQVDANELQNILNAVFIKEFKLSGFSVDCCRSMATMYNDDLSGKLGFDEFKELLIDMRKWKTAFKDHDADKSGYLNSYELRNAMNKSGFRLSNRSLNALVLRYSNNEGQIEFGDFIVAAIRLKTILSSKAQENMTATDVDELIQANMTA
ncbi:calpain-B-like isoform X2 [Argopecten irradians]|uniref:calpain-B-like isoform X2 n=1 Tax=Argopecten irradians TaxID=31199 RepID=UPI0037231650